MFVLPIFKQPVQPSVLGKYMIIGGAVGLAVICLFIFGVPHPKPEWGEYWRVRPLIITPLAGVSGGVYFYFISRLGKPKSWARILATVLAVLGFLVAIWMGIVLGLVGTLWN